FGGFGDMGDIFDSIFSGFGFGSGGGRAANPNAPRRGADIRANLTIDFMEACTGKKVKIKYARNEPCPDCNGTGAAAGTSPKTCPDCHGTGTVRISQRTPFGNISQTATCTRCGGKGRVVDTPCRTCSGQGMVKKTVERDIDIPAGIDDGQTLRVAGEGHRGTNGGPNGDLHISISVKPDPIFERDGYDVWTDIPITYAQATLGDEITVPTVGGKVKYTVPEGTQNNTVFRLKGKGIKRLNRSDYGDHYVRISVEVPRNLTREQKEKLREFEASLNEKNYAKRNSFRDKLEKIKDIFK
ncbi:MAG TPA: molecular chaperone DnaJ, partial [Ruminococcus sp.]|nr:molecular chaperone DnaJ [Ruminococcus sp.]